ncbi:hypothetical protein [Pseudarthrobacter sp. BIM B-2242]|uniref:hypothetical protein n=1 Tax=Pseudarthrobacter sp. BIM B-2242 TaxID=2772401 RepID=UPI00168B5E59|nr:hypothetical protein IDT60_04760 [Pseudarthrobacter sp. BIM B-2242]
MYLALFPGRGVRESVFAQPDWVQVHRELARVGVTLKLLHQEYLDGCSRAGQAAMSYDRFCRLGTRVPSGATIARLLSAVGQVDAAPKKRPKSSCIPFTRATAMALWQLDAFEYRLATGAVVTI